MRSAPVEREESRQHTAADSILALVRTHGLLSGRVTATDDGELLVAEDRDGAVADGAGRDARLPVGLLAGQIQPLGRGAGGKDEAKRDQGRSSADLRSRALDAGTSTDSRVSRLECRGVVLLALAPVLERPLRQVDLGNGLGDDLGAEALTDRRRKRGSRSIGVKLRTARAHRNA